MIEILGVEINEFQTVDQAVKELNKRGVYGNPNLDLKQLVATIMANEFNKRRMVESYKDTSAEYIIKTCDE